MDRLQKIFIRIRNLQSWEAAIVLKLPLNNHQRSRKNSCDKWLVPEISGSCTRVTGRFKLCECVGCFDIQSLIDLSQHSRKWQCPKCLNNCSLEDIVIDQYFSPIASVIKTIWRMFAKLKWNQMLLGVQNLKVKQGIINNGTCQMGPCLSPMEMFKMNLKFQSKCKQDHNWKRWGCWYSLVGLGKNDL